MSLRVRLCLCKRTINYTCKMILSCMCMYICVRACANTTGTRQPSIALVYVYTTYLEEFAGVLACICLTALTDPPIQISASRKPLRLALSHTGSVPRPVTKTFVLTNYRKTNFEFRDLLPKWKLLSSCPPPPPPSRQNKKKRI